MGTTVKEELLKNGNILFPNKGVSMRPLIREGKDLIMLERRDPEERCKKYDVVLFERSNGELVLHRITDVEKDGYLILGDNCIAKEYVPEENVLAVMTMLIRDGKKKVKVTDKGYLMYVKVWTGIYPIRKVFMRTRNKIKKI